MVRSGGLGKWSTFRTKGDVRTPLWRSFVQTLLQSQNPQYSIQLAGLAIDGETTGPRRSAIEQILGHEQVELYGGIVNDISMAALSSGCRL